MIGRRDRKASDRLSGEGFRKSQSIQGINLIEPSAANSRDECCRRDLDPVDSRKRIVKNAISSMISTNMGLIHSAGVNSHELIKKISRD
jgi:hypothetical protein